MVGLGIWICMWGGLGTYRDDWRIGRNSTPVSESFMMDRRTMMTYLDKIETYLQVSVTRIIIGAFLPLEMVRVHRGDDDGPDIIYFIFVVVLYIIRGC